MVQWTVRIQYKRVLNKFTNDIANKVLKTVLIHLTQPKRLFNFHLDTIHITLLKNDL